MLLGFFHHYRHLLPLLSCLLLLGSMAYLLLLDSMAHLLLLLRWMAHPLLSTVARWDGMRCHVSMNFVYMHELTLTLTRSGGATQAQQELETQARCDCNDVGGTSADGGGDDGVDAHTGIEDVEVTTVDGSGVQVEWDIGGFLALHQWQTPLVLVSRRLLVEQEALGSPSLVVTLRPWWMTDKLHDTPTLESLLKPWFKALRMALIPGRSLCQWNLHLTLSPSSSDHHVRFAHFSSAMTEATPPPLVVLGTLYWRLHCQPLPSCRVMERFIKRALSGLRLSSFSSLT